MFTWECVGALIFQTAPLLPCTSTLSLPCKCSSVITANTLINLATVYVSLLCPVSPRCLLMGAGQGRGSIYVHVGLGDCQGFFFSNSSFWTCPQAFRTVKMRNVPWRWKRDETEEERRGEERFIEILFLFFFLSERGGNETGESVNYAHRLLEGE